MNLELINASLTYLYYSSSPKAEHVALQCFVCSMFFHYGLMKAKISILPTKIFAPEVISHTIILL